MNTQRKLPQVPNGEISGPPLLAQAAAESDLGTVRRVRRCEGGSRHAVYQMVTTRGRFAVRAGPAEDSSQTWQQKPALADLHLAPRLLHEGTVVQRRRIYRSSVAGWLHRRPRPNTKRVRR